MQQRSSSAALDSRVTRAWHCQSKIAGLSYSTEDRELGGPNLTPLGERSGAIELEIVPWAAGSSQVEVVVDGRMDGGKFLEASHPPETEHRVFSSPERQV